MFTVYVTFMLKTRLSSHYVIKCLNSNYHMMRKCWTLHGENLIKLLFHKRVGNLLSVMNYDGVFIYSSFSRSQVFQDLTLCGLVMPYIVTEDWINIGSSNGLLPSGTKPLTEPMLSSKSVRSSRLPGGTKPLTEPMLRYNQ